MHQSTCKAIINAYLREGRVGKKKSRIRKLKQISVQVDIHLNPLNPTQTNVMISHNSDTVIEPSMKSMS